MGSFFLIIVPNLSCKGLGEAVTEGPVELVPAVRPPGRLAGEPAALPILRSGLVWIAAPRVFC